MSYSYRLKYKKDGPLKFISHLDLNTLFSRTVRRSQLPVELTQGFNPRYKISFGPALPLGFVGLQEVLDINLLNELDKIQIKESINKFAPQGLEILDIEAVTENKNTLSHILRYAVYLIKIEYNSNNYDNKESELTELVNSNIQCFVSQESIITEKRTKKGLRDVDLKPYIEGMETIPVDEKNCLLIKLIIDIQYKGSINPLIIINKFFGMFNEKELFSIREAAREQIMNK